MRTWRMENARIAQVLGSPAVGVAPPRSEDAVSKSEVRGAVGCPNAACRHAKLAGMPRSLHLLALQWIVVIAEYRLAMPSHRKHRHNVPCVGIYFCYRLCRTDRPCRGLQTRSVRSHQQGVDLQTCECFMVFRSCGGQQPCTDTVCNGGPARCACHSVVHTQAACMHVAVALLLHALP